MAHHVRSHHDEQDVATSGFTIRKKKRVRAENLADGLTKTITKARHVSTQGQHKICERSTQISESGTDPTDPSYCNSVPLSSINDAKGTIMDNLSSPYHPTKEPAEVDSDIAIFATVTQDPLFEFGDPFLPSSSTTFDCRSWSLSKEEEESPMAHATVFGDMNNSFQESIMGAIDSEILGLHETAGDGSDFLMHGANDSTNNHMESFANWIIETPSSAAPGPSMWDYFPPMGV